MTVISFIGYVVIIEKRASGTETQDEQKSNHLGCGILVDSGNTSYSYIFTAKHCLEIRDAPGYYNNDDIQIRSDIHSNINIIEKFLSDDESDVAIFKIDYIEYLCKKLSVDHIKLHTPISVKGYPERGGASITLDGVFLGTDPTPFYEIRIHFELDIDNDEGVRELTPGISGSPVIVNDNLIGIMKGNRGEHFHNHFICIPIKQYSKVLNANNCEMLFTCEFDQTHLDYINNFSGMFKSILNNTINNILITPKQIREVIKEELLIPHSMDICKNNDIKLWRDWLMILCLYYVVNSQNPEKSSLKSLEFKSNEIRHLLSYFFFTEKKSFETMIRYLCINYDSRLMHKDDCYVIDSSYDFVGSYLNKTKKQQLIRDIGIVPEKSFSIGNGLNESDFSCFAFKKIIDEIIDNINQNSVDNNTLKNTILNVLDNGRN